jgi:hypothetical protein
MDLSVYELYEVEILSKISLVLDIGVSDGVFLNRSAKHFSGNPRRIGVDPIIYNDFERWEYTNHKCKKAPKQSKENKAKWKEIIDNILNKAKKSE